MQNIFAGTTNFNNNNKKNYIKSWLGLVLYVAQDNPEKEREGGREREEIISREKRLH